jgi:hypothetical protein
MVHMMRTMPVAPRRSTDLPRRIRHYTVRAFVWSCALAIVGCGASNDDTTNAPDVTDSGHTGTGDAASTTRDGGAGSGDARVGDAGGGGGDAGGGDAGGGGGSDAASGDGGGTITCDGVGPIYTMASDPDVGAVDVSAYCLGKINGYRAKEGLKPYWLHDTSAAAMCCQAAEAKTAAEIGGHANGGCGWQSQGFCGGGRNPDGNVQASVDWCPRLFFEEGPTGGHYQAMMRVEPRGIMCSFYAVSRDRHSIVVNYY